MTISASPLCPHIETQGPGWLDWLRNLAVRPRAVLVFSGDMARQVKALDPAILTLKRRYDQWGTYLPDGAAGGRRWVTDQADLEGVDYLLSLNEYTGFDDAAAIRLANDFELGFVEAAHARGVVPVILNLAVGNPREDLVRYLAPCVQACGEAGGRLGYHGYGPALLLHGEEFLANRATLKLAPLLRDAGVTAMPRVVYTEGGFDGCNSPVISGGWRWLMGKELTGGQAAGAADAPAQIIDLAFLTGQYERYAARLTDLGVDIACLFTFYGTPQWEWYEHSGHAGMLDWYAGHLAAHVPVPPPPPPPAGLITLEKFILRYSGVGVDFDGHYGFQCVDLYRQYVKDCLGFPQNVGVEGAKDLWTTYDPAYYERTPNTPTGVPRAGDIVVWGAAFGPYGHVGMYLMGDVMRLITFDQNYPAGSVSHLQIHNYSGVLGWLRPRVQP